MTTILMEHLVALILGGEIFVFAHSSDGKVQGLFLMGAVMMKNWRRLQ
jgi:hypothetical protein